MSYTIEDFQIEIRKAETTPQMSEVIEKLLDSSNIDITDPNVKEIILEYRAQLEDYRKDMAIEEDKYCNQLIDSGECELYLCKKDVQWWKVGNRCYIRIDDTKSQYLENIKDIIDRLQPEVIEKLTSIKPVIWVISDNGIGTLKSRHLFNRQDGEIFEDYFEKV
jgi:hypothetical protein